MIDLQNLKYVPVIVPQLEPDADDPVGASGDAAPVSVDCAGWDYAMVVVQLGATDAAVTDMGLVESDAQSDLSDATAIAASEFEATGNPGFPSDTDDNKAAVWFVDLRKRKRYLGIDLTVADGSVGVNVAGFALLSRGSEAPTTAAARGFELGQVIV